MKKRKLSNRVLLRDLRADTDTTAFVQELLGHTIIAINLDTYCHVVSTMGNATEKALEDALT